MPLSRNKIKTRSLRFPKLSTALSLKTLCAFLLLVLTANSLAAEKFTVAAASDLRFALDEVISVYQKQNSQQQLAQPIEVIYGSSGKISTQILNGAPYDIFFSADISYPQKLKAQGFAQSEPAVYAIGRIVLWSAQHDASNLTLKDLTTDKFRRIAIAQPSHAPYGLRAQEALQAEDVWKTIEHKLVFAENIAQAAQMAESGAVDIAVIALSLAKFPGMATQGYYLIDDSLHKPLTQAYIITPYGSGKKSVKQFADFMQSDTAYQIMQKYGFVKPE